MREHFLGGSTSITICPADSDAFCEFKDKLEESSADGKKKKQQRLMNCVVDRNVQRGRVPEYMRIGEEQQPLSAPEPHSSQELTNSSQGRQYLQRPIQACLNGPKQERALDLHIAEFVYANNLPFAIVSSETFKSMIRAAMCAPASYKAPSEHSLSNKLLTETVEQLKKENEPMREVMMSTGVSIVCDGWDDNERNHLINFLLVMSQTHALSLMGLSS